MAAYIASLSPAHALAVGSKPVMILSQCGIANGACINSKGVPDNVLIPNCASNSPLYQDVQPALAAASFPGQPPIISGAALIDPARFTTYLRYCGCGDGAAPVYKPSI